MPYQAPALPTNASITENRRRRKSKRSGKRSFDTSTNDSFYIPWVLPLSLHEHVNVLFIYNGLDEVGRSHYVHYDMLAERIARRNIGVCIIPTPYHLNRSTHPLGRKRFKLPSEQLFRRPLAIITNYQRSLIETRSIISLIKGSGGDFKRHTGRKISQAENEIGKIFKGKIILPHLFGFSLGGLRALTGFTTAPDLFRSCILLNSGTRLQEIRPRGIVNDENWASFVNELFSYFDYVNLYPKIDASLQDRLRKIESIIDLPDLQSIINALGGGRDNDRPLGLSPGQLSKVLFIVGGNDRVMTPEGLARFGGAEGGLNILQVEGLDHLVRKSSVWVAWSSTVGNLISDFILNSELRDLEVATAYIQWRGKCFEVKGHRVNVRECSVGISDKRTDKIIELSVDKLGELLANVTGKKRGATKDDVYLVNEYVKKFEVGNIAEELLYISDSSIVNSVEEELKHQLGEDERIDDVTLLNRCVENNIITEYQANVIRGYKDTLIRQAEFIFKGWCRDEKLID